MGTIWASKGIIHGRKMSQLQFSTQIDLKTRENEEILQTSVGKFEMYKMPQGKHLINSNY